MSTDDDDLKLNSLNRFAKKSTRLALQEYSHCEVPAGCGGVVLRWTDPAEGLAAIVRAMLAGRYTGFLDGAQLDTARAVIPYGEHVLALGLERDPPAAPARPGGILGAIAGALTGARVGSDVLFAACIAPDVDRQDAVAIPGASTVADGTWRAIAADVPPEGWRDAGFDDSAWPALVAAPPGAVAALPSGDHWRWRLQELERMGAAVLLLPEGSRLWVRKRFTVAGP